MIPVKLSYFDIAAIDSIIGMCRRRNKPVRSSSTSTTNRKAFENANNIVLDMLEGRGTILKTRITY